MVSLNNLFSFDNQEAYFNVHVDLLAGEGSATSFNSVSRSLFLPTYKLQLQVHRER